MEPEKLFMQQRFIQHTEGVEGRRGRRLILFFAGWGMDASVFAQLSKPGYDLIVVYDYRTLEFDMETLDGYDEICVLAWSLGVWHADRFISDNPHLPFTRTVAVNGTLAPIDDDFGIPPRVYDLTSALPDNNSLLKFYRRICGGQAAMSVLMPRMPQRPLDELRDELLAVRSRIPADKTIDTANWDEIYLSDADLIFPFENMKAAWMAASRRVRIMRDAHHAIDFSRFIQSAFVDKELVGNRFASASVTYEREAEVQCKVAAVLAGAAADGMSEISRNRTVLEIGSGVGVLTKLYMPMFADSRITLWDLAPVAVGACNGNEINVVACDAETGLRALPDASVDTIFSSSTLQWFNSPRRAVREMVRALAPGGRAFISCYIDGTIPELSALARDSAMHYPQFHGLLESIDGVECDTFVRRFELLFGSAAEALAHMRATGVNSLSRKAMSIADTRRLMQSLTVDGKAVLTFNTQFIIIKKNG